MKQFRTALLVLALVALPLWGQASLPPIPGTVSVTANVCGPGATDPIITQPASGTTVSHSVIAVYGTATPNQPVEIYRNGILAGTGIVDSIGAFSVSVGLVKGPNELVARECSSSSPVNVTFTVPPGPPRPPQPAPQPVASSNQPNSAPPGPIDISINPTPAPPGTAVSPDFYLESPVGVLEAVRGETVQLPLTIYGGAGPLTLSITAGDGSSASFTATERSLLIRHTYNQAGRYLMVVEVTDAAGNTSYLQVVVQVDPGAPIAGTTVPDDNSGVALGLIFFLEQLLLALLFVVWEYYLRNRKARDEDTS